MNELEFKRRTKDLALRTIKLVDALPNTRARHVIGKPLLRSGTSAGANYRSACRARSAADILSRLGIVEEEADEAMYWMELLAESGLMPPERLAPLMKETNEILAMTVASIKALRAKQKGIPKSKIENPKSDGRSNYE